jgi:hypothetical protein
MYQNLFNYISDYSKLSLTVEEEELIKNYFRPKNLRKKQYFLQEGAKIDKNLLSTKTAHAAI